MLRCVAGSCSPGFGSVGQSECARCPAAASILSMFAFGVLGALAFLLFSSHKAVLAATNSNSDQLVRVVAEG